MEYVPGTETILLVEDEEALRDIVADMLGGLGYRVLGASDGKEALSAAQNFSGEIHVLVTDFLLPELDGVRLAESLRTSRPRLKVLFISGETRDTGLLVPGSLQLQKPFSVKALAWKIRELLQS